MNQIFTIKPYQWHETWVFDDPGRGLIREALVAGVPELIEKATQLAGIVNPEYGFLVLFSSAPFPGGNIRLQWVRTEAFGGNTYTWEGQEGWLCPALLSTPLSQAASAGQEGTGVPSPSRPSARGPTSISTSSYPPASVLR